MPLKEEIETKFLGVTIDYELKWQSHIDNVYNKLKSAAGMLAHIRHNRGGSCGCVGVEIHPRNLFPEKS